MAASRFDKYSELGIGIGLRAPHYAHILAEHPPVAWFEIISENYLVDGGRPRYVLDQILERYPVVQHGVSLYFGSLEPFNRDHLRRLKQLVRRTNTPWLTDHLCWGSIDGSYTHDLLPMPYTFEAVEVAARKVREARDFLEVPIAIENVSSYTEFRESQMTEWQFLTEVAERPTPASCWTSIISTFPPTTTASIPTSTSTMFPPIAYCRCIWRDTARWATTCSIRMISRYATRYGNFTPTPSAGSGQHPRY